MTHDDGRGRAMAAEMTEQPAVLRGLQGRHEEVAAALAPFSARTLAGVVIIARGSSDHAAIYGRYLLELATRRPVSLAAPSLSTRYRAQTDYSGYLAVAVSQSGHTPETSTCCTPSAARERPASPSPTIPDRRWRGPPTP